MKKKLIRAVAVFCVLVITLGIAVCSVSAVLTIGDTFKVEITADGNKVNPLSTLQLTATVTVPTDSTVTEADLETTWATSDKSVVSVDDKGLCKGSNIGNAVITATVKNKQTGETCSADYTVYCIRRNNPIFDYMENNHILSYRYSYNDDYFYSDNDSSWQAMFGFMNAFDIICPYINMEYDYVRCHFNYDDKAWMIQLWKGQYGLVYGSEIGVYYLDEPIDTDGITIWTRYNCATDKSMRLNMQQTLYWDELNNGNYVRQFTTPYEKCWWSTGFMLGHLWQTEPADELRMDATVELLSEEMAQLFAEKLEVCGFKKVDSPDKRELDTYTIDGKTVTILWQNISEAESTVLVKATLGTLFTFGSIGFFLLILFAIISFISMMVFIIII